MSEPQAAVAAAQLTRLEAIAAKRAQLGNLLTEKIADLPGIMPHQVHPEDRAVYWFYMFRMRPEAFRCDRSEFVKALVGRRRAGVGRVHQGAALRRARLPEARLLRRPLAGQGDGPDHDGLHQAQVPRGRGHPARPASA